MSQGEDEWEWEYEDDPDATETLLLDMDLTSLNGGLRSNIPGKRPLDRPLQTGKAKSNNTVVRQRSNPIEEDLAATPSSSLILEDPLGLAPNSVQILDFGSHNPIVSYQNEVYSCTWSDMVGTNMFFTPATSQWTEPEVPAELFGTSRIRLVGHKAKLAVKQDTIVDGTVGKDRLSKGTGLTSHSGFTTPAFKRQADFLERLKDAKKAKGDTDVVRTVIAGLSNRSTSSFDVSRTVVDGVDADRAEQNDSHAYQTR